MSAQESRRCELELTDGSATLSIGPRRDPVGVLVRIAMICMALFMFVSLVLHMNDASLPLFARLLIMFALAFLVLWCRRVGRQALWISFGREELTMRGDVFTWRVHLPGLDTVKEFDLADIKDIAWRKRGFRSVDTRTSSERSPSSTMAP